MVFVSVNNIIVVTQTFVQDLLIGLIKLLHILEEIYSILSLK